MCVCVRAHVRYILTDDSYLYNLNYDLNILIYDIFNFGKNIQVTWDEEVVRHQYVVGLSWQSFLRHLCYFLALHRDIPVTSFTRQVIMKKKNWFYFRILSRRLYQTIPAIQNRFEAGASFSRLDFWVDFSQKVCLPDGFVIRLEPYYPPPIYIYIYI